MYQLGVMGTADLWLTDHLLTTGSLFANLANNYDKFNYTNPPQDSHLPRVRTHVREYVQNDLSFTACGFSFPFGVAAPGLQYRFEAVS